MKRITFLILGLFLCIISCSDTPRELLNRTKAKMLGYTRIEYNQLSLYQNPMGTFDTTKTSILWHKNEGSIHGYDYITKTGQKEFVGIDGDFKSIQHTDKTVHLQDEDRLNGKYSPLTFLKQDDWKFVGDTVFDGKKLRDFYYVDSDTVIKGNRVYKERHIFINPDSELLERSERRIYFKDKLSQIIVYTYSDYSLDKTAGKLTYTLPPDYRTVPKGATRSTIVPKVGEEAPLFSVKDLNNTPYTLEDYRGGKVLLMFSIIRCAYCQKVLEHIHQEEYELSDNVKALYINPNEKQKDVMDYANTVTIPFPVIADAKEVGAAYGVTGFPSFFLIDEKGKIEKIVYGYNQEFLDSLKK